MVNNPSSNNISQSVIDLILLFRDTHELWLKLHFDGIAIMGDLEQQLPEHFGQLIRNLDLLDNFMRLGRTVRNFRDVKEVLIALNPIIIEKLQRLPKDQAVNELIALENLCYEAGRRFAIYGNGQTLKYPDDFLPGQIYSDN